MMKRISKEKVQEIDAVVIHGDNIICESGDEFGFSDVSHNTYCITIALPPDMFSVIEICLIKVLWSGEVPRPISRSGNWSSRQWIIGEKLPSTTLRLDIDDLVLHFDSINCNRVEEKYFELSLDAELFTRRVRLSGYDIVQVNGKSLLSDEGRQLFCRKVNQFMGI